MTKIICDICGKEMPLEALRIPIANHRFAIMSHGKEWDICNDCREKLNEWIKERKVEKYQQPKSVMRGDKNEDT